MRCVVLFMHSHSQPRPRAAFCIVQWEKGEKGWVSEWERKDANVVHSVGTAGCTGVYRRSIRSLELNSGGKWGERESRRGAEGAEDGGGQDAGCTDGGSSKWARKQRQLTSLHRRSVHPGWSLEMMEKERWKRERKRKRKRGKERHAYTEKQKCGNEENG